MEFFIEYNKYNVTQKASPLPRPGKIHETKKFTIFGMSSKTLKIPQYLTAQRQKTLAQEKNGKTQDDIYCAVHCGQTSPERRRRK